MSKKKVLMQRFNGTGYDVQYPETHVQNITGVDQTVASNVGVATTDAKTVVEEMSEIDYFVSPQGTTTGSATAYNLSIGSQYTALDDMDGVVIRAKFHTTTGDNPTLNVNGLGAKPILAENGANIPFQIGEGVWATLIWSSTLDGWVVQGWGKKLTFHKEIITKTTTWTAPEDIEGGMIDVMLFGGGEHGGGGGATYHSGGAGGHMAHQLLKIVGNKNYTITIGKGGLTNYASGGITSFDSLLSANGGYNRNGGTGGGGGVSVSGGNGSYGGGGGGGYDGGAGGNGGTYGGGGGGGAGTDSGTSPSTGGAGKNGDMAGGYYRYCGGGGGGYSEKANTYIPGKGENTIGQPIEFTGYGNRGKYVESNIMTNKGGGGGGGYGGNGGGFGGETNVCSGGGGGGGGYGGNGGSGGCYSGGGGGGYGSWGGTGVYGGGGGGGYGASGNGGNGGGGGGVGLPGGIAAGGGGGGRNQNGGNGGDGICILTYWAWE